MPTRDETVAAVVAAKTLNERVQRIRGIAAQHGTDDQTLIYADLPTRLYVPLLAPDFAYVHWRGDYELADLLPAYDRLVSATGGLEQVSRTTSPRCCKPTRRSSVFCD